ncbi:sodium/hydrogen exchanger 9B1 isoform X1 [Megachile rotundata]|uniref:sodium/hydrogen exchanger 9B1 isoform X1 n=1 Tax=Megachile rotundata TaxID=143995 RepID=UPI003FD0F0AA
MSLKWLKNWQHENQSSEGSSESTSHSTQSANEVEEDDLTCCHRMTVFSPRIRNILITEPVMKWLGQHVTWEHLFSLTTNAGIVLIVWVFLYFLLGNTMLPRNNGFGFYILLILSNLLGRIISSIPYLNLPPVLGMLSAGMIVRNTGLYDIHQDLGSSNAAKIRTFCLTFVAIRAGIQLSTTSLKKNPVFVIILAIIPCTMEMLILTLCCRYILLYPWNWSFMTGTILACLSPVVTVNCVLALAERGYGEDKGLATILCTAATFENVHVVSLFAICYANVFTNDEGRTEWWSFVPAGLRDALLAIGTGVSLGIFLVFFPHRSHGYVTWYRMIGLVFASVMCTTATAQVTISGGGYLAAMVLSFVAITGWKILAGSYDTTLIRRTAFVLWQLVQPILAGLVGADMDIERWTWSRFGLHVTCILLGLTAALGPMAYERARREADDWTMDLAQDVVEVAFVTMLLLAPLGSILINHTGPLLLKRVSKREERRKRELSYLRILSLQPLPRHSIRERERKRRVTNVVTA